MLELDKVILEDLENVYQRGIHWEKFRDASVWLQAQMG